jgi:hypothetical protein
MDKSDIAILIALLGILIAVIFGVAALMASS